MKGIGGVRAHVTGRLRSRNATFQAGTLKKRLVFYLSVLVLLGVNAFCGRYLFSELQGHVTALCLVTAGFSSIYWIVQDQILYRNPSPEDAKRKQALCRLVRMKERNRGKS